MNELSAMLFGLLTIVFFILMIGVIFGLGAFFGYTILKPLIKATEGKKSKLRFYTSDFFSLTFVLALPLLFASSLRDRSAPQEVLIAIGVVMCVIAIWVWFRGATKLSVLNVSSGWKRFVFLAGLLPVAMLGATVAVPMLIGQFVSTLVNLQGVDFTIAAGGVAAALLVAVVGQKVCGWVIRKDDESTADGTSEQVDDLFSTANDELKNSSLPFED